MIIGIDPGKTGAIAYLGDNGDIAIIHDMPDTLGGIVGAFVLDPPITAVAVVEEVHSMPGQGVASTFKFGKGYGQILGVLAALNIPTHHVTPPMWKLHHGLRVDKTIVNESARKRDLKRQSRQRAGELWPAHAALFKRVRDSDRAEACLIARWYYDTVVRRG